MKPSTFSRRLRGDIETIALKALEKEPDRRYQSAVELAADIRRYMHEEPIEARPPSVAYQIRMFARRNRVVFTAMAVIALTLVAAATVSAIFAINAELSRRDEVAANQVLAQKEETLLKSLDAEREARSAADEATAAARAAEAEQRRQRALTNRSFAQSARERGDWAEVRANVRSAIELGIDDPVPLMLWDVEAIWETTNAPGSITARLDEIEAHPDAAEHAGAIALWRAFAQFDPRITADRMRELIRAARQQPLPAFEAALADALLTETVPDTVAGLRRAHELDRYEPRALSRLLAGVILLDRYTEAEQLCRDWLARDPDNTKAWQYLAAIHARRGELDLAIEIIEGHYPATGDRRDEASKAILIEALQILSLFREAEDILLDPTLRQQLIERVGRYAMQTNSFSIGGPLDITGSIFGLKGKNGAPSYLDGLALSLPTMATLQRPSQERIELAEDRYAVLPNNHAAVGLAWSLDGAGRPVDASQLLRRHIESHEPADRWGALPLAGLVIELQLIVVMRDTDQERVDNLLWFITVLLQDEDANPAMLATAVYASVFTGRTSMLGWGLERLRQTVITDLDLWRRAAAGNAQNVSMRAIGLILATVALEQHPQDAELQAARDEITSGIESGGQPQERRIVAILRDIGLLPLRSSEPAEPDAGVAEPDDA